MEKLLLNVKKQNQLKNQLNKDLVNKRSAIN